MRVSALVPVLAGLAVLFACSCVEKPTPPGGGRAKEGGALENGSFTATLNGFRIHYEIHGEGPVLMTLPNSWGLSLEGLRVLYRSLEDRLTLVYFDPRGMGGSDPVRADSDMGLAAVRADFDALRQHLGLARVDVVGWSNGATNLILLAAERPETLSAAIFVHGVARWTREDAEQWEKQHADAAAKFRVFAAGTAAPDVGEDERNRRTRDFFLESWFPLLCADPEKGRRRLPEMYRGVRFGWRHFQYSNKETLTYDFTERLAAIRTPSLVIAGAHDMLPPERVRELHEGIEGSEFVVFENSGHFSPVEAPEAFQRAVLTFLGVAETP